MLFFFNDTATTEIYTLSLHDALPISRLRTLHHAGGTERRARAPRYGGTGDEGRRAGGRRYRPASAHRRDRKSTRLNSSHSQISYAVFCLKTTTKNPATSSTLAYRRAH